MNGVARRVDALQHGSYSALANELMEQLKDLEREAGPFASDADALRAVTGTHSHTPPQWKSMRTRWCT